MTIQLRLLTKPGCHLCDEMKAALERAARGLDVELEAVNIEADEALLSEYGTDIPVLAFEITGDVPYTVYDVSDRLRFHGWQVPAYTMPDNTTDVAVLRIVVREGFTSDLGEALLSHIREACDDLQANPPLQSATRSGFAH